MDIDIVKAKLRIFRGLVADSYKSASEQKDMGVDYAANKSRMTALDDVLLWFNEIFEGDGLSCR